MKRRGVLLFSLLGGAVALAASPTYKAEREVVVRVINNWNGGVCGGSTRCWSDMTAAWYVEMVNPLPKPWGHASDAWVADGHYTNGYNVDSHYTDSSIVNWGRDHWNDRPDEVDVAMIAMHGYNASGNRRWVGGVRVDEPGTGNCNAWQGHMEFGDNDIEFLHISSCVSMDEEDWHPNWSESFKKIHQINAFHGVMFIFCNGSSYPPRYREFADDSYYMPIALAWLDNMYDRRSGADNDQCPVSRGVGVGASGEANCWARMYSERYTNVHSDPVNPTWHGVIYMTPCNPPSAPPL